MTHWVRTIEFNVPEGSLSSWYLQGSWSSWHLKDSLSCWHWQRTRSLPLTEEFRLKRFGSQDLSVFLIDFLINGVSVYSRENMFEISGNPVKTCLICTGNPVKTCWVFCQWGCAASPGALAPKPQATRSTPEPLRKVHQNPFFFNFFELSQQVACLSQQVENLYFGLSRLNSNVGENHGWDFGVIFACFENSGWASSTRNFGKKNGLSRLNPNFWKIL